MNEYINNYIELLQTKGDPNESYKWEAIDHFQKNWDIDADDFFKMFKESFKKVSNLLYQNSWGFIIKATKNFPEDTRKMFINFFNEEISLHERFKNFENESEALLLQLNQILGKNLNSQQDERTLSVYLSFKYPERYYIYKSSFYRNLCEVLKIQKAAAGKKYFHYLELADKIKGKYVINNNELKTLHEKIYPHVQWDDLNLITQNLFYTTLENQDVYSKLMMSRTNIENINVFFGKVTNKFNQLDNKFYSTDNISWFGDLAEGDYVFIVGGGKIRLWKAIQWIETPNKYRMEFNEIFNDVFNGTKDLQAFKYFKVNVDLIVKTVRSTAVSRKAFFKIEIHPDFDEELLLNKSSYINLDNYRQILIFPDNETILNDEFNFQIFKQQNEYQIQIPAFAEPLGEFIDNTPHIGKGRPNKDKTLNKILQYPSKVWTHKDISLINLYDAFFCNYNSQDINDEPMETINYKAPLNQILYGAPGTGKTYSTKKYAVEIIEGESYKNAERSKVLELYDKYYRAGQIVFTTFHQSISYEDFIEGIKPVLIQDAGKETGGEIEYEIKDGIFKRLCKAASNSTLNLHDSGSIDYNKVDFYKMSLGGKHRLEEHNWSIDNSLVFLGWGGDKDFTSLKNITDWSIFKDKFIEDYPELVQDSRFVIQAVYMFQNMKIGDVVIVSKGNFIIDAIGVISGDYFYDDSKEIDYYQFREVKWLATNLNLSSDIFVEKNISQQAIYRFSKEDIKIDVLSEMFNNKAATKEDKKYVLIIDEINRGNVSSIFGELITLIEEDKRKPLRETGHKNEVVEVELPYSNKKFSVPDNLYIIGTMNTADRSVEALDTALRRRFSFVEMKSNPDVLEECDNNGQIIIGDDVVDLVELLKAINNRIEVLIDKDHQIGHSFFIDVDTIEHLNKVFKNKIIPLLEEYFFGNYGKIGLVLGEKFIKAKPQEEYKFAAFSYGEDVELSGLSEKVVYEFTSSDSWDAKTFISVYESK